MNKIGILIDYGNICTDYNTVYLDRDNNDKDTVECMTKVMRWLSPLLTELLEKFGYSIYRLNHDSALKLDEIVKKRFLFYSLEKEISAQTFILQKKYTYFDGLNQWAKEANDTLLVQNDDEGEGMYFYFEKDSDIHTWFSQKLGDTLDEVPFPEA
jgi:hypothetical protein